MKTPTHEAVAQRAQQIWNDHGRPVGRDDEFWFEAEHQLAAESSVHRADSAAEENSRRVRDANAAEAFAERDSDPQASEDAVGHQVAPQISEHEAGRAKALQRKEARAPRIPGKDAPRSAPPESGKPLWRRPHSS